MWHNCRMNGREVSEKAPRKKKRELARSGALCGIRGLIHLVVITHSHFAQSFGIDSPTKIGVEVPSRSHSYIEKSIPWEWKISLPVCAHGLLDTIETECAFQKVSVTQPPNPL